MEQRSRLTQNSVRTAGRSSNHSAFTQGPPISRRAAPGFFEAVYEVARMIPKGRVTTYSSIARYLGNPRGARAVGWAMRVCTQPDVPCHRVVRADGRVSGYPEDVKKRIKKLKLEKILVRNQRVDVAKYYFVDFKRN